MNSPHRTPPSPQATTSTPDSRPPSRRSSLTAGAVAGIAALTAVVIAVPTVVIGGTLVATALRIGQPAQERSDPRTVWVDEPFERVTFDTSMADITVVDSDVERPRIIHDAGAIHLRHHVDGNELVIETDRPSWDSWNFDGGRSPERHLTLQLPRDHALGASLVITTFGGDVTLDGRFGDITATTSGGDFSLEGKAASLALENVAGDSRVNLDDAPARMSIQTSAGDQDVTLPVGDYGITTKAGLGDIRNGLGNNPDAARQYRFESRVGDILIGPRQPD